MKLSKFGSTANCKTISGRCKRTADDDLDNESASFQHRSPACCVQCASNNELAPLPDAKVPSRQATHPRAVYVGLVASSHVWSCTVCEWKEA
jgi:hypothetical protein